MRSWGGSPPSRGPLVRVDPVRVGPAAVGGLVGRGLLGGGGQVHDEHFAGAIGDPPRTTTIATQRLEHPVRAVRVVERRRPERTARTNQRGPSMPRNAPGRRPSGHPGTDLRQPHVQFGTRTHRRLASTVPPAAVIEAAISSRISSHSPPERGRREGLDLGRRVADDELDTGDRVALLVDLDPQFELPASGRAGATPRSSRPPSPVDLAGVEWPPRCRSDRLVACRLDLLRVRGARDLLDRVGANILDDGLGLRYGGGRCSLWVLVVLEVAGSRRCCREPAGRTVSSLSPRGLRKRIDGHEDRPDRPRWSTQLGDPVPGPQIVIGVARVGVEQIDQDLAAIAGVDGSGGVDDGQARAEPPDPSGDGPTRPSPRYGDRDPGRHQGPLALAPGQLGDRRAGPPPRRPGGRSAGCRACRCRQPDEDVNPVSALASVTATGRSRLWVRLRLAHSEQTELAALLGGELAAVVHQEAAGAGELVRLLGDHPDGQLLARQVGPRQLEPLGLLGLVDVDARGALSPAAP
jgi:hypothetical protein